MKMADDLYREYWLLRFCKAETGHPLLAEGASRVSVSTSVCILSLPPADVGVNVQTCSSFSPSSLPSVCLD